MEPINSENNQYSDCPEDAPNEDSADSSSSLNTPLPNNSPSNHKEPSYRQQSGESHSVPQIKVNGPRHPTMIASNVDSIHILPYSGRERTFSTASDTAPRTYWLALQGGNKD
ncbi:hypothetical protein O181_070708 [Austropuccinia psidii MF-1]|uniref:Uncharacterized protein n=1 Tax=Austropuccinia psidii MF-1 TaxID=1389203 RepID=A0A9Q3I7I6_9BASI|nr:hypothetical protein [Austropuccinia psidii MF-1]